MPKGSAELVNNRENEIIDACAGLYETMSFKEITMKDIGNATSFTRTSIYNYFQTKEEIFLALLGREYAAWNAELAELAETEAVKPAGAEAETVKAAGAEAAGAGTAKEDLAALLAGTLSKRGRMLRLLSMNIYDIEENSRVEKLVEFKKEFRKSLDNVGRCLKRLAPEMTEEERNAFVYSFFSFIHGIYPYTSPTEKQLSAMRQAGIDFIRHDIYEMVYMTAKKLLGV